MCSVAPCHTCVSNEAEIGASRSNLLPSLAPATGGVPHFGQHVGDPSGVAPLFPGGPECSWLAKVHSTFAAVRRGARGAIGSPARVAWYPSNIEALIKEKNIQLFVND